ncbi:metabotropic glutamate receptor 1-like [Toxorhynchites rutilus septentrionalis]|uniref:metabotropic glutamate receptor 1-like n=1 Tax=Toxorhynchites rutilus septentrionalis TaxID=329112 RepID=UPI00247B1A84|nr:metabotropic glutamate receptor 1-like [Toxorhynchites rutilus septentrionalis]XP_055633830.1 metabotropic glutamate receptor 1-like [Toxorhynchites rutilus septentrionalis]XP_055633836.1 metabotropic glutamate receptor 1-like [Toxorhynchites rutilus septentrionalis]XP_055633841.1 metabotropic glutamate receptor 1-like [Toxorhynchites rutilus septentrionalis]XP_055633847.1 metabotropic glutamate receptor 1-like [Toxorhynchites rutilus septentrionalis]XP_055633851.1 metabotropic glutamate re
MQPPTIASLPPSSVVAVAAWLVCCIIVSIRANKTGVTTAPAQQQDTSKRTSAHISGDFIIGVLFSVHHQPRQKRSGPNHFLACGEVREHYGIQRSEITFKTIDEINQNPALLPNITLGVEIRDSCWYAPVALQQSIELIRDSISPPAAVNPRQTICLGANQSISHKHGRVKPPSSKHRQTLIGVIGPGSSSVALQVQNLLQLFSIPQIGYSTTSKDLSDKARYSTFMRVVPSDYYQAQVMIDVVRQFNWTYVSAINTDENYGQSGIQAFRELAEKYGVCIAREDSILSYADDESFSDVLRNIEQDPNANVVVCFCEGMTVRGLLKAMERLNMTDRFLLIGSDGWADRADVVQNYERQALGSISIRIHSPYVKSFDNYYFSLNPFSNKRNPWFQEFWESKFNCQMPTNEAQLDSKPNSSSHDDKPFCSGNEKLSERYKQEPKMSFVIKAIYTMAYALHALQQDACGRNSVGICPSMFPFSGTQFLNYLMNVSFTYEPGDVVEFDTRGDPPGRYDIMNYQLLADGAYDYVQVGEWNNGSLNFFRHLQESPAGPVESVCSKPCLPGFYKNLQTGGQEKQCCWVCVPCERHQILYNETHCRPCDLGYWPDESQTECLQIPIEHVQWGDTEAIVAISFSVLGFIMTGLVFGVFMRHNDTPVVKSSTRELCYLILVGMIISHSTIFAILAKPSTFSCLISRSLPGISFAMIYASLLVKTNRIARILAGSKKRFPTKKPKFMSAAAQLIITGLLISIEVAIAVFMLIIEPPSTEHQYPTRQRTVLACNTTRMGILVPLAFIFLLIILCTLYAWKTRNVPENFNEAKFIGFAMYTTCVIWVAFVPIYFGSESKIITMCICISLSAMVTLVFLFLPKLYIILIRPEKNIRALFTTSKTIRCHIGSRVASAISHKTSSSYSSGPGPPDDIEDYSFDAPKPIIRSSSCQTSLELLNKLLEMQLYGAEKQSEHSTPTSRQRILSTTLKQVRYSLSPIKTSVKKTFKPDRHLLVPEVVNHNNNASTKNVAFDFTRKASISDLNDIPEKATIRETCYHCAQLDSIRYKYDLMDAGGDGLDPSYNLRQQQPNGVYLIPNSNQINNIASGRGLGRYARTTISEESLSECSISTMSESCDCKFKSITIKLPRPGNAQQVIYF